MKKRQKIKLKGFTLIELLVVISIIAVLMSVLMPALQKARQQAYKTICLSNCHQWALGINMYAADYNDYFPTYHHNGVMPTNIIIINRYYAGEGNSSNVYPHDLVNSFFKPYLPDYSVVWCPDTPANFRNTGELRKLSFDQMLEKAKNSSDKQIIGDYVFFVGQDYNKSYIKQYLYTDNGRYNGNTHFVPPMKTRQARPDMALMGDTVKGFISYGLTEYHHPFNRSDTGTNKTPDGMNASFNDGSSRWAKWDELTHHTIYGWSNGYTFLWPDPKKSSLGNIWDY